MIQNPFFKWNAIYKKIANAPPSGTTKEDWIQMACEEYLQKYGRPFGLKHLIDILHTMPKFGTDKDDETVVNIDDGDQRW